jgi:hypothetical protein
MYKREDGITAARAIMCIILNDFVSNFNVGQSLTVDQVAITADFILENYGFLKIDDLKLCFKNTISGRYGQVYRLDVNVIISWIDRYVEDRMNESDEISHNEHLATKTENRMPIAEDVYKSFEKKNYR